MKGYELEINRHGIYIAYFRVWFSFIHFRMNSVSNPSKDIS